MQETKEPTTRQLFVDADNHMVEVAGPLTDPVTFGHQGGGFSHSMPKEKFDTTFKPAKLPGFHLVRVTGDWLPETFAAEAYTDGQRWNGWATPRFLLANAKELMTETPNLRYDEHRDVFIATMEGYPAGEDEEVYGAETVDIGGTPTKVYAIGAFSWCWELAD